MKKITRLFPMLLAAMILLVSGSAMAQTGFGVRAGVSADPAQFHVGAHYVSEPLVGQLSFRPNLELGFGNDLTVVAANFEFAYKIPLPKTEAGVYIGAGPALVVRSFSESSARDTDTGGGFNVLLGIEHSKGLFGELKVGTIDSPEIKFTIGYTFH